MSILRLISNRIFLYLGAFATIVSFFAYVGMVSADHFDYLAEDDNPGLQVGGLPAETYLFYWWALTDTAKITWAADASIRTDVSNAINRWQELIPELGWQEITPAADVTFFVGTCGGGQPADFSIDNWWSDVPPDGLRNSNYILGASICINSIENWGTNGRLQAIMHEIGHMYGLHERYRGHLPANCNDHKVTTMDTSKLVSNQRVHCDDFLIKPTAEDANWVKFIFSDGEHIDLKMSALGSTATAKWLDGSLGEIRHQIGLYWFDGVQWVLYHSNLNITLDTGTHASMKVVSPPKVIQESVNVQSADVPSGRWHIACGDSYFAHFAKAGTWRCSNIIWIAY